MEYSRRLYIFKVQENILKLLTSTEDKTQKMTVHAQVTRKCPTCSSWSQIEHTFQISNFPAFRMKQKKILFVNIVNYRSRRVAWKNYDESSMTRSCQGSLSYHNTATVTHRLPLCGSSPLLRSQTACSAIPKTLAPSEEH